MTPATAPAALTACAAVLAYTPFVDPIDAHRWWFVLLVPMCLGVALAYKSVRCGDLSHYPRQVLVMTAQVLAGIIALALGMLVLVRFVLPLIAPMPA